MRPTLGFEYPLHLTSTERKEGAGPVQYLNEHLRRHTSENVLKKSFSGQIVRAMKKAVLFRLKAKASKPFIRLCACVPPKQPSY